MNVQLYHQDQDGVELYLCFPYSIHVMQRDKFVYLLLIGLGTLALRRFCHSIKYVLLVSVS
jgi:hypothetical protein